MARKQSLTSMLYRAARTSNNLRAASRGPGAFSKRMVRREAYKTSGRATGGFLRLFGIQGKRR